MKKTINKHLPKSLFGRALLIIMLPITIMQIAVVYFFFNLHWDQVTSNLSDSVAADISVAVQLYKQNPTLEQVEKLENLLRPKMELSVALELDDELPTIIRSSFFSNLDKTLSRSLNNSVVENFWFDTTKYPNHIDIRVKDQRLVIDSEDKYLDAEELTLRIYYKDLNEIDVSGAIELTSEGVIETKRFRIEVSGACDGELELDAKELEIDISGGGEIDLAGRADRVDIRISGAGEINGLQLKSKDAQIDITGAGEVELDVEKSLDISVTGAGEIRYSGDPEVTKKVSGAGEITQIKK